jgi:hypothetical protein
MSYTVYTHDVERGPSACTQHTFMSLDALIEWATSLKVDASDKPARILIDTSALSGVPNVVQMQEAIVANDWTLVAKEYLRMVCNIMFERRATLCDPLTDRYAVSLTISKECAPFKDMLTEADVETIISLVRKLPISLVCKTILPELESFGAALEAHISEIVAEVSYVGKDNFGINPYIFAKHQLVKELLQICNFSQMKTAHSSWPREFDITESYVTICKEYMTASISEETREKIMTVLFMTYYSSAGKSAFLGSSELFEDFSKMEFNVIPKKLVDMVKGGMTYRHVKHALSEIMVGQVRRADGQRYVGIKQNKLKSDGIPDTEMLYTIDDSETLTPFNNWPVDLKPE